MCQGTLQSPEASLRGRGTVAPLPFRLEHWLEGLEPQNEVPAFKVYLCRASTRRSRLTAIHPSELPLPSRTGPQALRPDYPWSGSRGSPPAHPWAGSPPPRLG